MQILAVCLLGVVGVLARWGVDSAAGKWFEIFPVGILVINILGSFVAGIVYAVGNERGLLPAYLSTALLVGFCGGFTTFSAYSLQAALYFEKSDLIRAAGYFFLSPALGFLGALLGLSLGRSWAESANLFP